MYAQEMQTCSMFKLYTQFPTQHSKHLICININTPPVSILIGGTAHAYMGNMGPVTTETFAILMVVLTNREACWENNEFT